METLALRKPQPLRPRDRVAIVAPSSPFDRKNFEEGVAWLRNNGFEPTWDEAIFSEHRYLAGDDKTRARVLQEAILDDDIAGIFCARGGYGSARLLPHLDATAIKPHCKVFVGFSDVTTLHLFLREQCGWVTFHGPMVATRWAGEGFDLASSASLLEAVTYTRPMHPIEAPTSKPLRGGVAKGPLVGGNLALLCHTIGTQCEPDTDGAILLLEDVHEAPYRVDRMLTHLRQAGKLSGVRGIVVGEMLDCDPPEGSSYTIDEVIEECLRDCEVPILTRFPISHGQPNYTVPLGVMVELDADQKMLTPLECALALETSALVPPPSSEPAST
jgi:muramoyltetrapeptide carboxypeptidase